MASSSQTQNTINQGDKPPQDPPADPAHHHSFYAKRTLQELEMKLIHHRAARNQEANDHTREAESIPHTLRGLQRAKDELLEPIDTEGHQALATRMQNVILRMQELRKIPDSIAAKYDPAEKAMEEAKAIKVARLEEEEKKEEEWAEARKQKRKREDEERAAGGMWQRKDEETFRHGYANVKRSRPMPPKWDSGSE